MTTCHLCWARQHGYSERDVRRPGEANARCTEHMRRMPTRFVCDECGEHIMNTAGAAESLDEAASLLGEVMAYLMSDEPDAEEDRRDLMRSGPETSAERGTGVLCHGCWHQTQPDGGRHQTGDVCAYHGYQEMLPEGLYRCAECDRGMILLHTQSVSWIREKFDLPFDQTISRSNPEHQAIRDFMYEYAEMQETTRRN